MSSAPARRKEDKPAGRIFTFIHRFFFIIGVAAVISVTLLTATLFRAANYVPPGLPDNILLTYTFRSALAETIDKPAFDQPLFRPPTTFHEIVHALASAANDKRVKGFVARIDGPDFSLAQYQEMRDAVAAFRKSGKYAYVFADNFGGFTSGTGEYYLASAFEKIWLQPVGMVAVTGVATEVPFLRGILDKVGVKADLTHIGRYKSAPDSLTETGMTELQRSSLQGLTGDLFEQIVADVSAGRNFKPGQFRDLIDRAPLTDEEALAEKMVDQIGYADVLTEEGKAQAGTGVELVDLRRYAFQSATENLQSGMVGFMTNYVRKAKTPSEMRGKAKIAVVFGSGTIMGGAGGSHAGFGGAGEPVMQAGKISAALRAAIKDEQVAAIVFRIDSPGGEPSAAELIRRAVVEAKEKGKPVVVSMGGMAASGGYWIASPADKIVAEPATITGSIGIFGGKMVLEDLWQKLGVNWDGVSFGRNATMWSSNSSFTPQMRAQLEHVLDSIYRGFRSRVEQGRKMTPEQVMAVAEGRVFTGRQAKENGLVDELGGLDRAVEIAKQLARLDPAADIPVERFPPQRSPIEMLMKVATDGASLGFERPSVDTAIGRFGAGLAPLTLPPEATLLRLPLFEVRP